MRFNIVTKYSVAVQSKSSGGKQSIKQIIKQTIKYGTSRQLLFSSHPRFPAGAIKRLAG